mmetsp:Transcript_30508/g.97428  ORF Transcript_30508/g.97428 Transcript_30508/m.97428 type:complete len:151 (-) Transcript_30508:30-482(-)
MAEAAAAQGSRRSAERVMIDAAKSTLRVLIADSNTESREEVAQLLRECSYEVTAVESSKRALEFLQRPEDFDIILKEHELPTVDGTKLLSKMLSSEKLSSIPVVMISTQDERDNVVQCLHMGAADYLIKPLRRNELRNLWTRVWFRRVRG